MKQKRTYLKVKEISLKVGDFLDQKGFYLVIFLCIIVIGATIGVVSIRDYQKMKLNIQPEEKVGSSYSGDGIVKKAEEQEIQTVIAKVTEQTKPNKDEIKIDNNKSISNENKKAVTTKQINNSVKKNQDKKVEQPVKTIQKEPDNVEVTINKQLKFDWPVFGKIINSYAKDSLIFSKTLQQWTTHEGVDIYSEEGTPVRTAAEGVIKSIKNDPVYGITIIIEHKDGTKTIYANLSTGRMVKVGQVVKRGKAISGIGRTSGFECEDETHLHFEVIKDGNRVNPSEYLPSM